MTTTFNNLTGNNLTGTGGKEPMVINGMSIKPGPDMTRIQLTCPHQSGLLYVVPANRSWVCDPAQVPAHTLAGFFRELVNLNDGRVASLMQDWGLYYRQLPLDGEARDGEG